jgi:hypothetical protein
MLFCNYIYGKRWMTFMHSYNGATQILSEIGTGTCKERCKQVWTRNIRRALGAKTNPLKLTQKQCKTLSNKLKQVSPRNVVANHSKTLKKYKERPSPPFPANKCCGKKMAGNDGSMYLSTPNKNGVCAWRKI